MARIIVIDDHVAVREAVRRALESEGHDVLEASDGDVGLQLLASHGADLVVTDIFMPGQDGIVTVRRIRREFPTVKVIVMSGGDATGRMNLLEDAVMLGAARSLPKPFTPAEVRQVVREVLTGGQAP